MATLGGKSTKKRKHSKRQPKTLTPLKKKQKPSKFFSDSESNSDSDSNNNNNANEILNRAPKNPYESSNSDSDSESEEEEESLSILLEPYSKSQLIELIADAAARDAALSRRIRQIADRDVSHRKIFVHGLAWDASRETLSSAFGKFGEIEDCNVVLDKSTGKAKGYGFVLFKTRRGAAKSLKCPQKRINNRVATCQLASLGPPAAAGASSSGAGGGSVSGSASASAAARKIYVGNVPADTDVVRFRDFFAKFGEIEAGPIGFDVRTGKSRGFALFVYKTVEGFERALREPRKVFEGQQLNCQKAAESKPKTEMGMSVQVQANQLPPPMPMALPVPLPHHHHHSLAFLNPMMYGTGGGGFVPGPQFGSATSLANGLQQVYPSMASYGSGASAGPLGSYPSSYVW